MDNDLWSFDTGYFKLKTARQKKRLQKEDSEKQLRALHKLENKLWREKQNLPFVPLEIPYQKGWVRTFRLRDDVARSNQAEFYQTLLKKINTKDFCNDKSFLRKKRGKRKKGYEPKEQWLRTFTEEEWSNPKLKITEQEKQHFFLKEYPMSHSKCIKKRYTFIEPWRYVFQIKPHMITHAKLVDEVLEQQMQQLENRIERHHLYPKIRKLMHGNVYSYHDGEKHQYYNPIKNKQLPDIIWEAMKGIL
ncbi:hypothetical protein F0919_13350 [Taibaiella lutea]|uniref:Uncharacterized protein n=1 Tax=Taibaiella lutea TaxID=2608001 RepID=A0A5M6CEI5_9BACT|nr:hypothetical protein [Taibaiella lutea]KAA5533521.1 hypothetical protein F0919_13350 [Taibaiella lutea]